MDLTLPDSQIPRRGLCDHYILFRGVSLFLLSLSEVPGTSSSCRSLFFFSGVEMWLDLKRIE